MANFLFQQPSDLLSSNVDRSQSIVSQSLNGVKWGVSNEAPTLNYKNTNYNLDNPYTNRPSPIPDNLRTSYQAPVSISPENHAMASKWLSDNHAVISQNTTGINKANHDDMHAKAQSVLDDVANGRATPEQAQQAVDNDESFQASPVWAGGIAAGLALMSGRDPLETYQIAQGASQKAAIQNQLMGNTAELRKHYTVDSIQAAITTGDRSLLVPRTQTIEEKAAAEEAKYQRDRADQRADQAAQWQHQDEAQQRSLDQQKELFQLKEKTDRETRLAKTAEDEKKANEESFNKRVAIYQNSDRKQNQMFSTRLTSMNAAEEALKGINDAGISDEEKRSRYVNSLEQMYKGINPSSSAEITMDKLESLAGISNVFTITGNKISTSLTGAPLDAAIKQVQANLKVEKGSTKSAIDNNIYQGINNDVQAYGNIDEAIKIANASQHRTTATKEGYNKWLENQDTGEEQEQPSSAPAPTQQQQAGVVQRKVVTPRSNAPMTGSLANGRTFTIKPAQ